jgi:hypothetical protein
MWLFLMGILEVINKQFQTCVLSFDLVSCLTKNKNNKMLSVTVSWRIAYDRKNIVIKNKNIKISSSNMIVFCFPCSHVIFSYLPSFKSNLSCNFITWPQSKNIQFLVTVPFKDRCLLLRLKLIPKAPLSKFFLESNHKNNSTCFSSFSLQKKIHPNFKQKIFFK